MKKQITAIVLATLSLFLSNPSNAAVDCGLEQSLSPTQLKRLKRADRLDRIFLNRILLGKDVYTLDVLRSPKNELVILLGEAHIKGPRSSIIGKNLTNNFSVKMLEGIPKQEADYIATHNDALNDSLGWQRKLLQVLTFNFFGSTISTSQKSGLTYLPGYGVVLNNKKPMAKVDTNTAEDILDHLSTLTPMPANLNLPLEVGSFLTPSSGDDYILNARNVRMTDNIEKFASSNLIHGPFLAIVGSAHNKGMRSLLHSKGYDVCLLKGIR